MTKGEYRINVDFNPSGDDTVNRIKRAAADFIDMVEAIDGQASGEIARLKAQAQTTIEDAAMWAVKAATNKPMAGDTFQAAVAQGGLDHLDPFIIQIKEALGIFKAAKPINTHPVMWQYIMFVRQHLESKGFRPNDAQIETVLNQLGVV